MENSPPTIPSGEDFYVELGEGITTLPSQLVDMVKTLEQETIQLHNSNEWILKANEEQENFIRDWTDKSIHKSVDTEGFKNKKEEIE